MRQFDRGRPEAGAADAPSARQIQTRLKHPWPKIVEVAPDPTRDIDRTIDTVERVPETSYAASFAMGARAGGPG